MPAHFPHTHHFNGLRALLDNRHLEKKPPSPTKVPPTETAATLVWPKNPTVESIGETIASHLDIEIVIRPIPDEFRHREISGLTTMTGRTAYVYIDPELSPLNREQTIFHEYAHILHGDVRPEQESIHLRSMFDNPIEKRAETTGMHLLNLLHRHRLGSARGTSAAFAFMAGLEEAGRS